MELDTLRTQLLETNLLFGNQAEMINKAQDQIDRLNDKMTREVIEFLATSAIRQQFQEEYAQSREKPSFIRVASQKTIWTSWTMFSALNRHTGPCAAPLYHPLRNRSHKKPNRRKSRTMRVPIRNFLTATCVIF